MRYRTTRGFTLIELIVTVALAAILLTVAVPGFRTMIQNNRATAYANQLVSALNLARSESVRRKVPVSVCASTDQAGCAASTNWATGWIVFTDTGTAGTVDGTDTVLRVQEPLQGNPTLNGDVQNIQYLSTGAVNAAANFTLALPDCQGNQQRIIAVNAPGRPAVSRNACP